MVAKLSKATTARIIEELNRNGQDKRKAAKKLNLSMPSINLAIRVFNSMPYKDVTLQSKV